MSEVLKKVPTDEVVETLYNDLRRRIGDIEPNDAMVAPDYADLTLPILVGTRCTHNRGLYKCNTQINSSEAWTAAHWDEITVGSELDDLQDEVDDKYEKPSGGIPASDLAAGVIPTVPVQDVQIAGTSVLQSGVANIPESDSSTLGVVMIGDGLSKNAVTGKTNVQFAPDSFIRLGGNAAQAISPARQHTSVFYGLTKAAGVDMAGSDNAVGTYTDPAKQAIQKMLGFDGILCPYESDSTADQAYAVGEPFVYNGKMYKATDAISIGATITPGGNCELATVKDLYVRDIQANGTSILQNGIANIPASASGNLGLVRTSTNGSYGINVINDGGTSGDLRIKSASSDGIKAGSQNYQPITPSRQHESVFYALSKLAGVDLKNETVTVGTYPATAKAAILAMLGANGNGLQILNGTLATNSASTTSIKNASNSYAPIVPSHIQDAAFFGLAKAANADMASLSDVTVGQYPQAQKTAIQTMLGIEADVPLIEEVSGTTPSITGMPNVRYVCGTVSTLSITPPASGSIVVRFTSGSTATVLTVPSTVKFPEWFDYTELEADTVYEIIITDGVYGGVMSWAD